MLLQLNYKINFPKLICFIVLPALLVSCNTNNKVVSSFGKRKYTKGYYFNFGSHKKLEMPVLTDSGKNIVIHKSKKNCSRYSPAKRPSFNEDRTITVTRPASTGCALKQKRVKL
jgi:hypothetical protein